MKTEEEMLADLTPTEDDIYQHDPCTKCDSREVVARPMNFEGKEPQVQIVCLRCGEYELKER